MWKIVKKSRWLVYVILPFLLSTISFGEMTVTKYEVERTWGKAVNNNAPAIPNQTPDLEAKLREALELLEKPNPDSGKLGKLAREIEELDQKIRADFTATENELRSKNASVTILKRHQDFVAQYQENMEALKEGLKVYDPGFLGMNRLFSLGADSKAKEIKVEDLKKKLRDKWIPKEFNPFKDGRFPKKNADFKPREPQLTPSITPAYDYTLKSQSLSESSISTMSDGSFVTPNFNGADNYGATAEDLQETIEIRLTPEIKELARELDYNPVKIYEYVRNNIDYAPYYGSVKGAQETLWQKSGNDFDQASLLMALLRASGIPCRYVYGVVEIPVEKVKNWIGIEHDQTALNTFPTNGIPAKGVYIGDKAAFLRKEHVWVEALVPVNHYRGSGVDDSGKGWVPMDPSFKEYVKVEKIDLQKELLIDGRSQALLDELQSTAIIGDNGASTSNVDVNLVKQKLDECQKSMQNFLNTHQDLTAEDIYGTYKIVPQNNQILPLSLPYQVLSIKSEFANIPDNRRQKISFKLEDINNYFGESQLNYLASIPNLASKIITLSYEAATEADKNLINSYMPDRTDEIPTEQVELPAYLIKVKPQLKVDGMVVATGNAVSMGTTQKFYLGYHYPSAVGDTEESIENEVIAGGVYVITLDTGKVTPEIVNRYRNLFTANSHNSKLSYAEQLLHLIGLTYFMETDRYDELFVNNFNVRSLKLVSEAITSIDFGVKSLFGLPRNIYCSGLGIDIDKDLYSVRPINGDNDEVKKYFTCNGSLGSFMEGAIFEQLFEQASISTVHIFLAANQQGIKLYQIDSTNLDSLLPKLQYDTSKRDLIKNQINAGKVVFIPEKSVTIGSWTGTGYLIQDKNDGSGVYMIDGGTNGGVLSWKAIGGFVAEMIIGWLIAEILGEVFPEPESKVLSHLRSFLATIISMACSTLFTYLSTAIFLANFTGWLLSLLIASLFCFIIMYMMFYLIQYADEQWVFNDNDVYQNYRSKVCLGMRRFLQWQIS